MGLLSWLRGLFGGGRTTVPRKITEFRNRPTGGGGASVRYQRERSEPAPGSQVSDRGPLPESLEMFELAGDRAAHQRQAAEAAALERESEPEPEEEPEKKEYRDPFAIGDEMRQAGEEAPHEPGEEEAAVAEAREPVAETEAPVEEAEAVMVEEEAPAPEKPVDGPSEEAAGKEEAEISAETAEVPVEEVEAEEEEPSPVDEPLAAIEEPEDEHHLDTRDVKTVVGEATITIERKRLDTKTMNIGGTKHEIVLYEYQNGTKAARVPREAINQMTEIAKQNNLKVLPMQQNAAIMAGRFLGVPRSDLQDRAEKEEYFLVDFTDTYYEICFDPLPSPPKEV